MLVRYSLAVLFISLTSAIGAGAESNLHGCCAQLHPVLVEGRIGFVDQSGRLVVPAQFERLGVDGEWLIVLPDASMPTAAPVAPRGLSEYFDGFHDGVCIVRKNGRLGFMNSEGELIVPPRFEQVCNFRDGLAWGFADGEYSLINQRGEILREQITAFASMKEGLVGIEVEDKWGFIDCHGEYQIAPEFDAIGIVRDAFLPVQGYFEYGAAQVWKDGRTGLIGRDGQFIVRPTYSGMRRLNASLCWATNGEGWALVDHRMGNLTPFDYAQPAQLVGAGLIAIRSDRKWGCIDECGMLRVPFQFDFISTFSDGLARVKKQQDWGYIDTTGRVVIAPRFAECRQFSRGIAQIRSHDRSWGLVDRKGRFVVAPTYKHMGEFSNGVAPVRVGRLWGAIDAFGNVLVEPAYESWHWLGDGIARVELNGKVGVVRSDGRYVIPPVYEWLDCSSIAGLHVFAEKGRFGFCNAEGQPVIPAQYDYAEAFDGCVARVAIDAKVSFFGQDITGGKWGYIDRVGEWLWDPRD